MPDRPRGTTGDHPAPIFGKDWRPARLRILSGRVAQIADLFILGVSSFSLILMPLLDYRHGSVHHFVETHITLRNILLAAICLGTWRVLLVTTGLYAPMRTRSITDYLFRAIIALNSCTAVIGLVEVVLHRHTNVWHSIELFWATSFLLMLAARFILLGLHRLTRTSTRGNRNLVIIGTSERALEVYEDLKADRELKYALVGYVQTSAEGESAVPRNLILGNIEALERILMRTHVDEVVITLPIKTQYEAVGHTITVCQMLGIESQYLTDQFGTAVARRRDSASLVNAGPQVIPHTMPSPAQLEAVAGDYRLYLKRILDIVLALIALGLLAPVWLVTALVIRFTSPGPVLVQHQRYGLDRRLFQMYRFRSKDQRAKPSETGPEQYSIMIDRRKAPPSETKKERRFAAIGSLMRRWYIDELPQLVNVLRGDMSLVGPRPLPLADVDKFDQAWLLRRFSVKPGLTCLWQIVGRSSTNFDRWIELDLQYIDNWSLSLDLLILARTVPAMIVNRPVSDPLAASSQSHGRAKS